MVSDRPGAGDQPSPFTKTSTRWPIRAADRQRFAQHVLRGPRPADCWLWLGAIADDGYGRFWFQDPTTTSGQRAVGAHRFALALLTGSLSDLDGLHSRHLCHVPLCVRATADDGTHLVSGTRSDNMRDRAAAGRGVSLTEARWRHLTRQQRGAQSRRLRDALRAEGWNDNVVRELMLGIDPEAPTLF